MDEFFKWLGPKKSAGIRMAVMDMWKPFRNSTKTHAPQASILFDKFHVLRHLGEALDTVRKSAYTHLEPPSHDGVARAPGLRGLPAPLALQRVVRERGIIDIVSRPDDPVAAYSIPYSLEVRSCCSAPPGVHPSQPSAWWIPCGDSSSKDPWHPTARWPPSESRPRRR